MVSGQLRPSSTPSSKAAKAATGLLTLLGPSRQFRITPFDVGHQANEEHSDSTHRHQQQN